MAPIAEVYSSKFELSVATQLGDMNFNVSSYKKANKNNYIVESPDLDSLGIDYEPVEIEIEDSINPDTSILTLRGIDVCLRGKIPFAPPAGIYLVEKDYIQRKKDEGLGSESLYRSEWGQVIVPCDNLVYTLLITHFNRTFGGPKIKIYTNRDFDPFYSVHVNKSKHFFKAQVNELIYTLRRKGQGQGSVMEVVLDGDFVSDKEGRLHANLSFSNDNKIGAIGRVSRIVEDRTPPKEPTITITRASGRANR